MKAAPLRPLLDCLILLVSGAMASGEDPPGTDPADWTYLDNGTLRLGVLQSAGGGIGYLGHSGSQRNWLNHYDRGRLIQQSYYGDEDGSKWVDQPWRLNPVQGGDYRNKVPSDVEISIDDDTLHVRSTPLHWATGEELTDFEFSQRIELKDDVVHARFRMTYRGTASHQARHQEMPAVFLDPELSELVFYQGDAPWTDEPITSERPGQANEYFPIDEHWAGFVGEDGIGVGVFVPKADRITCYRFPGKANSDCSYLAPITTFALEPGRVFEYDAYFTIGTVSEMRERFAALQSSDE